MLHKEININFKSDGFILHGLLHIPADSVLPPVVIGSHGLFSTSESPKQVALAKECNDNGIAFFRFDHRGCGASEGDFKEVTSLKGRSDDILNALDIIRERHDIGEKTGLFGSSFSFGLGTVPD